MRQRLLTLTLLFFLTIFSANGQNWTTDTLVWGNKHFITELPDSFTQTTDKYTEGVFVSYIFPDTATFTIFYGWNATVILHRQSEFDTLSVNSNIYSGTIGQSGKLWKAVIKSDNFIYWYNLVDPEQAEIFERILNSFHLKTEGGGR